MDKNSNFIVQGGSLEWTEIERKVTTSLRYVNSIKREFLVGIEIIFGIVHCPVVVILTTPVECVKRVLVGVVPYRLKLVKTK